MNISTINKKIESLENMNDEFSKRIKNNKKSLKELRQKYNELKQKADLKKITEMFNPIPYFVKNNIRLICGGLYTGIENSLRYQMFVELGFERREYEFRFTFLSNQTIDIYLCYSTGWRISPPSRSYDYLLLYKAILSFCEKQQKKLTQRSQEYLLKLFSEIE